MTRVTGNTVGREPAVVYAEYAAELTRYATVLVGPSAADDLVAEACLKAFASPGWADVEHPRAYLYRAVLNEAHQAARSGARRLARERRVAEPDRVDPAPVAPDVLTAMQGLSPRQRAVVFFTYWQDRTSAEIANDLGHRPTHRSARAGRRPHPTRRGTPMSDLLTPHDELDEAIRATVHELVATAPPPRPFDQLDRRLVEPSEPRPGHTRRWSAVAAAVIVALGLGALVVGIQVRSGATTPATDPTVAPPHPTTGPTGPDVATTRPPLPDPGGLTVEALPEFPAGQIHATSDDLVALTESGDLWWHPGALGDTPGEPVQVAEGHPPLLVNVVGSVNGSLITNFPASFDQPAAQITAITAPLATPTVVADGSILTTSHDGTRILVQLDSGGVAPGIAVFDLAENQLTRRGQAGFANGQPVWSADDRELYVLDPWTRGNRSEITRVDSVTLEPVDTTVVGQAEPGRIPDGGWPYGVWRDRLVVSGRDGQLRLLDVADFSEAGDDVPWDVPPDPTWFELSPDGETAAWVVAGDAYLQRAGGEPILWQSGVRQVSFVRTPVGGDGETSTVPTNAPTTAAPVTTPAGDPPSSAPDVIAPSGSIDAAPGDMVAVTADGDLWLYPGAFDPPQYGRSPGAPVRLVDMGDPREPVTEGEGPNEVSSVGGFVNGALIYGDCCEPVSGNLYSISEPDGPRANWAIGWAAAANASGRRWAAVDPWGVSVYDYDSGRAAGLFVEFAPDGSYQQFFDVTWSPDETEVWVLGAVYADDGMTHVLVRYRVDETLAEVGRRELLTVPHDTVSGFGFAGHLTDGTVVLAEHRPAGEPTALHFLGPDGDDIDRESPWTLPEGAVSVSVSPDGTTLAYMRDGTVYLQRDGQDPVVWGTDLRAVWFVTTPATPTGTPCPDDAVRHFAGFADLDGDRISERIMTHADSGLYWLRACGSHTSIADVEIYGPSGPLTVTVDDIDGDGRHELVVSALDAAGLEPCQGTYGLVDSALTLIGEWTCTP
ncbi:MAG TPA: sigma factor [Ilumatobacter sp.]|nr:sigma factor [Ilumatobacter sp.]